MRECAPALAHESFIKFFSCVLVALKLSQFSNGVKRLARYKKTRYDKTMRNLIATSKYRHNQLPLFVEKDEDGFYVVECPLFEGCYTQGKTMDEALQNIREVIALILQEKESRNILKSYQPRELSLHTITL